MPRTNRVRAPANTADLSAQRRPDKSERAGVDAILALRALDDQRVSRASALKEWRSMTDLARESTLHARKALCESGPLTPPVPSVDRLAAAGYTIAESAEAADAAKAYPPSPKRAVFLREIDPLLKRLRDLADEHDICYGVMLCLDRRPSEPDGNELLAEMVIAGRLTDLRRLPPSMRQLARVMRGAAEPEPLARILAEVVRRAVERDAEDA